MQGKDTVVIGDIHGCLEQLVVLLERENIINSKHQWAAGETTLAFLGDYMDRGLDGIGVLDFIMNLEVEAKALGGEVIALLGNHDVIMLEVYHFGDTLSPGFLRQGTEMSFKRMWLENAGGQITDLERLEAKHVQWLSQRPAMHIIEDTLLMHADSEFYLEYGSTLEEINQTIRLMLEQPELEVLDRFEERFASRMAFLHEPEIVPRAFATRFGAKRIVHGHTTVYKLVQRKASEVLEPFEYAKGSCINLDHALCYGGTGFVYRF